MAKYLNLYFEFIKQNIKIMFEYRLDFIIGAFSTLLTQLGGIFFVWIIFENIKSINGWTFYEVALVYGLMSIVKAINHIFFDSLWVLGPQYIKSGKFDILMLRPLPPLFHLIANHLNKDGLGEFLVGLIIAAKSISELNIHFGVLGFLLLILFIICGSLIFAALNIITATASFKIVNSVEFMWAFFMNHQFAQYPIVIYPKIIRETLTWVLPYAFASFYPAAYFLHKGYADLALWSPIVTVFLWMVALQIWNFGLKHYTSTGS